MPVRGVIIDLVSGFGSDENSNTSGVTNRVTGFRPEVLGHRRLSAPSVIWELVQRGLKIGLEADLPGHIALFETVVNGISYDALASGDTAISVGERIGLICEAFGMSQDEVLYLTSSTLKASLAAMAGYKVETIIEDGRPRLPSVLEMQSKKNLQAQFTADLERQCLVAPSLHESNSVIRPRLPASVLTLYEASTNSPRWRNLSGALKELFPLRFTHAENVYSFVEYKQPTTPPPWNGRTGLGAPLLWRLKNWNAEHSGEQPDFVDFDFVAYVMAASLPRSTVDRLVPAPSTGFSKHHPAQLSIRLAIRLGLITNTPVWPGITKNPDKTQSVAALIGLEGAESILIIDDQFTSGSTLAKSMSLIFESCPLARVSAVTWSASVRNFDLHERG